MSILPLILLYLATVVAMEFWSAFAHRYIYHGVMWRWHKSHHRPRGTARFERNDLFFVAHAVLMAPALMLSIHFELHIVLALSAGITTYGLLYILFHDGFIHGRLPLAFLDRFAAMRRMREDHLYHHTGDPNAHFGLFFWNRKPDPARAGRHAPHR